jgi:hypothetical protein
MARTSQRTIAVLRGVKGNESIGHSFLLTIHAFWGLYKATFADFFGAKGGAFK